MEILYMLEQRPLRRHAHAATVAIFMRPPPLPFPCIFMTAYREVSWHCESKPAPRWVLSSCGGRAFIFSLQIPLQYGQKCLRYTRTKPP
jgi:hypothetical protein